MNIDLTTALYLSGAGFFALLLMFRLFRRRSGLDAQLVANRRVPPELAFIWNAAAFTWGTTYLFMSSLGYEGGWSKGGVFMVGNTAGLLIAIVLMLRMRRPKEKYTLPGAIRERYDDKTAQLYAYAVMVIQVFWALAINFKVATTTLPHAFPGMSPLTAIVVAALVMLTLMAFGGICSSASFDIIKGGMMLSLILVLAPVAIHNADGFGAVLGGISGAHVTKPEPWWVSLATSVGIIVSLTSAGPVDQSLFQRYFATEPRPVRHLWFWIGLGVALFVLNMAAAGSLGLLAANPSLHVAIPVVNGQPDAGIAGFVAMQTFAPYLAPFFILTIMVSFLASGDTALNASTSVFVKDVYERYVPGTSEAHRRFVQIAVAAIFTLPAAMIAYSGVSMLTLLIMVGVFRAALFVPTIAAFFTKKSRLPHVFWSIVLAMLVSAILYVEGYKLLGSAAGWTITGAYVWWKLRQSKRSLRKSSRVRTAS